MVGQGALIASQCICCDSNKLQKSSAVLMPFVAKRVFDHEPFEITSDLGFRDLAPGMVYTLCNSLQCQDCGVLFLDYRFTNDQMSALYYNYRDEEYNKQRVRFEPGYAGVISFYNQRADYTSDVEAWLLKYLPESPVVLDWGGDTGINSLFRGKTDELYIYDISEVDLLPGVKSMSLESVGDVSYDLIACCQVLEHVSYPQEQIKSMLPAANKHTLIYLEVPVEALFRENPDSCSLVDLKKHWHEHINFFTEESMRRMLEKLGLEIVDMLFLSIDLGWTKSKIMGVLARLK